MSVTAAARARAATVAAVALTAALGACSGSPDEPEAATPTTPAATSLAELDADALAVVRTAFCESVDADEVEAALGGPLVRTSHYVNGQRARLTSDVRDVAHENGCTYLGEDRVRARGWVFVPPVTAEDAEALVADAAEARGCEAAPGTTGGSDGAVYGDPSTALVCRTSGGRGQRATVEVSYRGLFGAAWVGCSLEVPRADAPATDELVARADAWCLEVAEAAAT